MKGVKIAELIKSVKVKDVILIKRSLGKDVAYLISRMLNRPCIMVDDFTDFSSIGKAKLKKLVKSLKK